MANGSDRIVDDAKSEKYVKRAQFAPGCCLFTLAGVKSSKRHTLLQKDGAPLFASTASKTCKWRSSGLILFSLDYTRVYSRGTWTPRKNKKNPRKNPFSGYLKSCWPGPCFKI